MASRALGRRIKENRGKIAASKRSASEVANAHPDDLKYGGSGNGKKKKGGRAGPTVRAVGVLAHSRIDQAALARIPTKSSCLAGVVAVVLGSGSADPASPYYHPRLIELVHILGGRIHASRNVQTNLIIDADEAASGASVANTVAKVRRAPHHPLSPCSALPLALPPGWSPLGDPRARRRNVTTRWPSMSSRRRG